MSKSVRIALDVMGGDHGPAAVIPGAAMVLERRPDISFLLYGDESQMRPLLARYPKLVAASTVIHTPVSVKMSDKPSQALRQGRRTSSMWLAIDAVKRGEAAAAVSAGNTGALMAMATFCLRTMTRIERPAIACVWPNIRGRSIVLDVGATVGADAQHLVEMAIMGAEMARILFGLERPTVGIINVGVEEIKGIDEVKAANRILRAMDSPHFAYSGFIEGNDIAKGTVDVAVTDGFSGNIALKSAEGTIRQFAHTLREELSSSLMARLGYLMAHGALGRVKDRMDPRKSNGGVLLGLNGFVIKSHGGTDAAGFAFAVEIGHDMVHQDLLARIRDSLAILDAGPTPAIGALASGVRS